MKDTKHRLYHSWQLVFRCGFHEIQQISWEIWQISWHLLDFMWNHEPSHCTPQNLTYLLYKVFRWISHEIFQISWNPLEIREICKISWNMLEICKIHQISWNLHEIHDICQISWNLHEISEIHWISWLWAFAWWPSIGLSKTKDQILQQIRVKTVTLNWRPSQMPGQWTWHLSSDTISKFSLNTNVNVFLSFYRISGTNWVRNVSVTGCQAPAPWRPAGPCCRASATSATESWSDTGDHGKSSPSRAEEPENQSS